MITCKVLSEIRIKTLSEIKIISAGTIFKTTDAESAYFLVKSSKIKILSENIKDIFVKQSPQCPPCPQTQYQQGIPDADIENMKSAMSTLGGGTTPLSCKSPGQTNKTINSWDGEMQELIAWFKTASRPNAPFSPAAHIKIVNPEKHYAVLEREIGAGLKSPRSKYGALKSDLSMLKNYFEDKNKNDQASIINEKD